MTSACPFSKELLLLAHFGEAEAGEARRAAGHAAACPECRAFLADLAAIDRGLEAWPVEPPLPQTLERIERVIRIGWKPRPGERTAPEPALPFLLISGLVALLLLSAGWLRSWVPDLPLWAGGAGRWVLQLLGPFGVSLAALLLLGAFASLALLPALLWDTQNRRDTWRTT